MSYALVRPSFIHPATPACHSSMPNPAPPRPSVPAADTATLIAMLKTCRPHGSPAEQDFVDRFLTPLGVTADGFGNLWLSIGQGPTILWSSHTDTCHRKGGSQRLAFADGVVRLAAEETANCLGADCTAGVWLMREMITSGIPGTYVFHRGEERGGLGSAWSARNNAALLARHTAAIAFDRRGTSSIITHQRGGRSASDAFALSLAAALRMGHHPDPTGTFTDTANYTDLIGECSNVSIGYDDEHGPRESLDLRYLLALREAVLAADLSQLAFQPRRLASRVPLAQHAHSLVIREIESAHESTAHAKRQQIAALT